MCGRAGQVRCASGLYIHTCVGGDGGGGGVCVYADEGKEGSMHEWEGGRTSS